ncbi:MAG: hypothetical protein RBU30_10940 [Polyangia bacterium]|jgi:hypothetical protein|nr:hypothetical protein [Polyangia bacterium]
MKLRSICVMVAGLASWGCSDDDGGNSNSNNTNSQFQCGDGVRNGVEECDDGAANSDSVPDACRTDCQEAHCGDGIIDTGEECDDGPQNSDIIPDACRTDCTAPRCGDGVTDLGEGEGCDCGDGTVDLPRRCQEPNSDAEGATCRTSCVPAGCGDGRLEGEELCDGDLLGGGTCQQYGYYQGQLACTAACSYDFSGCSERCNDGVVNGDEACDGEPPSGETCLDYGFDFGRLGCSSYCTPGFADCGHIGWKRLSIPAGLRFNAIWFDPNGTAWLAGYDLNGGVIGRIDGTQCSQLILPQGTGRLWGIWGSSASNVYAVGEGGAVLHFDGSVWSAQSLSGYLYCVWGSGPNDVYVVGQDTSSTNVGYLWRFNGTSWTSGVGFPISFALRAVWGSGPNDVYAVGQQGNLLHFNGATWTPQSGFAGHLMAVWGTSAADVFVAGAQGIIHFDGSQWTQMSLPASASGLTGLWGTAPDNVFAVGGDPNGFILHYDGSFWREFVTGSIGAQTAIAGSSDTSVLAVGGASSVRRFTGLGWTRLDLGTLDMEPRAIWGASPKELFVAGNGVEPVYRSGSGGWTPICPGFQHCRYFRSIWGSGPSDVLFVGGEDSDCPGSALRYLGGSCTLTTLTNGFANNVFGRGPTDVWVAASDGSVALARFTSGWNTVPGVSGDLYDVWVGEDGQVFSVGNSGLFWHYQAGSWQSGFVGGGHSLWAMWGSSSSDVHAIGGPGEIVHYDGAAWTALPVQDAVGLQAIWGKSSSYVFAGGDLGTLLHHDGVAWAPVRTNHVESIRHIWGIGKVTYVVRGDPLGAGSAIDGLLDLR